MRDVSLAALLFLEGLASPLPDLDERSLQGAIWVLSDAVTVPRQG